MVTSTHSTFSNFIEDFQHTLKHLFKEDIHKLSMERGISPIMDEILSKKPLSVAIPEQYGGRGSKVKECLSLLAAASYESLPLSLIFGINIALFLEPVAKYAEEPVKKEIFSRFLENNAMGGLMISEPDHGSDALNMKTLYREIKGGYQIKGIKHWQGLTGVADYWLIASREQRSSGQLNRDIDFFICDVNKQNQQVVVEEFFDNLGLDMIPYGRNLLELEIPSAFKLKPKSTGIKMMLDILHRSRMQFPGMGMGFIKRMLDEAITHCQNRVVGAGNLLSLDQVQFQISRIQSAYTICSAMCARSSGISGIDNKLAAEGLEANSMKAVVTDLMQESAQLAAQLHGANGYRTRNIAGRGLMDSRPFQIFEGSNEMLYSQIAEVVVRTMKKQEQSNFLDFLKEFELTSKACLHFEKDVNFSLNTAYHQRKLVDLGKIMGRIVSVAYVLDLKEKGFREDLTTNCVEMVKQEVAALITSFHQKNTVKVIDDYSENSTWLQFV